MSRCQRFAEQQPQAFRPEDVGEVGFVGETREAVHELSERPFSAQLKQAECRKQTNHRKIVDRHGRLVIGGVG